MSESVRYLHPLTVEEYLELEEGSAVKHEYVGGEMHAMAGASYRYNQIAGKIFRMLSDAADGTPCRVYMSDMRVRIGDSLFYYPDGMVVCEPLASDNPVYEDEPCLIVEVISPSTEKTDRREKLANYQNIPTLESYVMVAQDRRWVTHYFRDEGGAWRRGDFANEGSLPIPCPPGTRIPIEDIYAGLQDITPELPDL